MEEPLHSWQEYFIAKKVTNEMNIQYLTGNLSERDIKELEILSTRIAMWNLKLNK